MAACKVAFYMVLNISLVKGVFMFFTKRFILILIFGFIEAFIIIPLHGKYLEKHCKKQCTLKCKMWNCKKWHDIK